MRPINTGMSSTTILGTLKSRSARINTYSKHKLNVYTRLPNIIYIQHWGKKFQTAVPNQNKCWQLCCTHLILGSLAICTFQGSCYYQHRLDGPQPPIIMILKTYNSAVELVTFINKKIL
jgi:hypothetical protein